MSEVPESEAPVAPVDDVAAPAPEGSKPSWIGIWALVLSLLGLVGILPILGSVLGLVLGRVGIRRSTERPVRGGRGLSLAAFIIGLVTLTVIALGCAAYALIVAFAGT
ncbi:MAG: hypothetical protein ACR2KE_04975 [Candidatus Nanopelagicales bacterium]